MAPAPIAGNKSRIDASRTAAITIDTRRERTCIDQMMGDESGQIVGRQVSSLAHASRSVRCFWTNSETKWASASSGRNCSRFFRSAEEKSNSRRAKAH